MSMVIASARMGDEEILRAFRSCELPASSFRHGDHLRLAWLQLHRAPADEALECVRTDIRRFAAHHGMPDLFHDTLTTAWVRLIATHRERDFAQFIKDNEHRLNRDLLYRFWTPGALDSEAAKRGWLAPDRAAFILET